MPSLSSLEEEDDDGLPKAGDRIADKYVVEGIIGRGGMGAVFRARNELTGRRVAIKWILPFASTRELEERLMREARAMGLIEHPNVVQVLDVGRHERSLFLVLEYLHGSSLRDLTEGVQVDPATAIRLLFPAMSGIAAAHSAGVIHRDLKPENLYVCVDDEGHPFDTKVLDFGISKIVDKPGQESKKITRTGTTVGTPAYMSPEQVMSKPVDQRSDVYALGVILFELLSARLPYEAEGYNAIVIQIATGEPLPLRLAREGLDPVLEAVVERAMAKEPDTRYPDVASFARALEPFAGGAKFVPGRASVAEGARITEVDLGPIYEMRASGMRAAPVTGATMDAFGATIAAASQPSVKAAPVKRRSMGWAFALVPLALLLAGGGAAFVLRPWESPPPAPVETERAPVAIEQPAPVEEPIPEGVELAAPVEVEEAAPPPAEPAAQPEPEPAREPHRGHRRRARAEAAREGDPSPVGRSGTISADDF